MTAEIVKATDK